MPLSRFDFALEVGLDLSTHEQPVPYNAVTLGVSLKRFRDTLTCTLVAGHRDKREIAVVRSCHSVGIAHDFSEVRK